MSEWTAKPLGELVSFQKGRKVDTADFRIDGYLPYLGASAISGHADGYADPSFGVLACSKDILMLWDGERSGLVGTNLEGVISSTVARLNVKDGLTSKFLYYALQSKFDWIQGRRTGTGVPHVPKDLSRILVIDYPHKEKIQEEIANILSTIDAEIEQTEALIAKGQKIKAGMMQDLFTRGVTPDGHLRPTHAEAPHLYKESTFGWIPKEWDISGLASKGRAGTSWIRTGPFGSALKGEHWRTHGCPVITIGALGEGEFTYDELLFIGKEDAARLRDFQMKAGDVVFSRVADVGRSVVVREAQVGWIMSSNLMRIAVDENLARPDFLQMALAGDIRVKAQIRSCVNSGGRDVANSEVLSQIQFVWPSINEQDRIIRLSHLAGQNLNIERLNLEKLRLQKQGLMHDLLTGRVRVSVPDNEKDAA